MSHHFYQFLSAFAFMFLLPMTASAEFNKVCSTAETGKRCLATDLDLPKWNVTEKSLVEEAYKSSHQITSILAGLEQAKFSTNSFEQKYQWQWVSKTQHSNSDEKSIAAFFPTFGPTYLFQTGVKKKFVGGASIESNLFVDQQSTTDKVIDRATRSGVNLSFSVDLWKNIFGRMDKAELGDIQLQAKKTKIESDINIHITVLELRKLYWSLISNDKKIKITKELLKTSEDQLQDAVKRGKQYIADKGEVARYRAQVSSRNSTIKILEYQRDLLQQSLKKALPDRASAQIILADTNDEAYDEKIYTCAVRIGSYRKAPWENTEIDELLELIEQSYAQRKKVSDRYSDIDIQLQSKVQLSGVDQGYANSFDDFSNNGRSGYQVGLQVSVPLGASSKNAKKSLVNADYNRYLVDKNRLLAEVQAKQTQIVSMVGLLKSAIDSLRENEGNLVKSIRASNKKFKQARISLNALIAEQDALLNSRLTEVDTRQQVINTLLDYFQTFTKDPCQLNNISNHSKVRS